MKKKKPPPPPPVKMPPNPYAGELEEYEERVRREDEPEGDG